MKQPSQAKNVTPKIIAVITTPTITVRPNFRILETTNSVALVWAVIRIFNYHHQCHRHHRCHHRQQVRKLCCHFCRKKRNVDAPYRGNQNWNGVVARHHQMLMSTKIIRKICPNRQQTTVARSVIHGGIFWCPIISNIGDFTQLLFVLFFIYYIIL